MASATPTATAATPAPAVAAAAAAPAGLAGAAAGDAKQNSPTKQLVLKERQVPLVVAPGKVNAKVSSDLGKLMVGRASRADLMKRGLLKEVAEDKKAAPAAAAGAASAGGVKATGDKLKNFFVSRPTKQRLLQLNVIKETATEVNPAFTEMKRQFEDSRRKDLLSNFLTSRPKPEEIGSKLVSHEDAKSKLEDKAKAKDVLAAFLTQRTGAKAALDQKIISDIGEREARDSSLTADQFTPKLIDELKGKDIKHVRCGWGHTAVLDGKGDLYMFGSSQNGRLGLGEPTFAKRQRAALEAKKAAALRPDAKPAAAAAAASGSAAAIDSIGGMSPLMRPPNPFGRAGGGLFGGAGAGRPLLGGNKGKLMREAALAADARAKAVAEGKPAPAPAPAAAAAAPVAAAPAPAPAAATAPAAAASSASSSSAAASSSSSSDAKDAKDVKPEEDIKLDDFYTKPQLVKSLHALGPVSFVDLGDHHSAAIVKGVLYTWGEGSWGRLGLGHNEDAWIPTAVDLKGEVAVAVSCGSYHTLVLTATNKVFGFGWNKGGRIGLGDAHKALLSVPEPMEVSVLSSAAIKVVSLSAGANCSIALDANGKAYSWGCGSFGNLGHGDESDRHAPTPIAALAGKNITHAVFGAAHALALAHSGEIYSWGQNTSGQLGRVTAPVGTGPAAEAAAASAAPAPADAKAGNSLLPTPLAFDSKSATHIAAGKAHSALTKGGVVYTWGKGSSGVLGHGSAANVAIPTAVAGSLSGQTATNVECGWLHTVVLTSAGAVVAFGGREHGKLGF